MTPDRHRLVSLALTILVVDLGSKAWASTTLDDGPIELPGPLDLRLSYNRGVAFSFFTELPTAVLVIATSLVAGLVIAAAFRGAVGWLPAGLIAGGAIANIIDRVHNGSVVDMLHTSFWPTFNLADVAITCGAALWIYRMAKPEINPEVRERDPSIDIRDGAR
jgi:signal peptidase II